MALESGTYIDSLNAANPASTDGLGQADDHIRLIKSAIKATFPNLDGAVTASVANLNNTTAIPSTLTDLGISDGSNGMVLTTNGSGSFSFTALPAGATDTNYYVNGGSFSGTTLTLQRSGLSSISITGFPQAITNNNQLTNGAGYITSVPTTQMFGIGQSWQTTSISVVTWYQNTSSKAQAWKVRHNPGSNHTVRVGSSTSSYTTLDMRDGNSGEFVPIEFIVPPNHFFYLNSGNSLVSQYKLA
jgi:hypothetical protein